MKRFWFWAIIFAVVIAVVMVARCKCKGGGGFFTKIGMYQQPNTGQTPQNVQSE